MADKKRYKVVRGGPVGGYGPGEAFEADPGDPTVQAWVVSGAVAPVTLVEPKVIEKKDAVKR